MAVEDSWHRKPGKGETDPPTCEHKGLIPSLRHGRGLRFRVRWHGHSQAFRVKRDAEAYWLSLRTAAPEPDVTDVTVGELADDWLATKRGLSTKGYEACAGAAGHVRAAFGSRFAGTISRTEVETWLANMPGSASLRTKALQCMSGAMRIGVERGAVTVNPCAGIRRPKQRRHEAHFLTPQQLEAVAAECGDDARMVMFLGTTGVRVGEAVRLDVTDVDRRRRRARVRESKNGEARDVPVPEPVLGMLDLSEPGPLFRSPAGHRVHINNWRARVFQPAAARAGVRDLRVHDLRHTAASLAIRSGADVKAVQRMLGHKSAAMTLDVYGHLWDQGLDDVAARMGRLIGSTSGTTRTDDSPTAERDGTTSGTDALDSTEHDTTPDDGR